MLKLNFYQLDRLIAIILPDLHSHFKVKLMISKLIPSLGWGYYFKLLQRPLLHNLIHKLSSNVDHWRPLWEALEALGLLHHCKLYKSNSIILISPFAYLNNVTYRTVGNQYLRVLFYSWKNSKRLSWVCLLKWCLLKSSICLSSSMFMNMKARMKRERISSNLISRWKLLRFLTCFLKD